MKIEHLIEGLKTLNKNIQKALKPKNIRLEDMTPEQKKRFYERRFIELEVMSKRVK